jgi:hypothetical protein
MLFSTTWLEFKDMAQDPLVRREPVSTSCYRPPDEGLEAQKYSLCPKEHPANCPLRWRLNNGLGCISHDCKLDLVTIQGNLTGDQYIRDVLQPVVVPHFDNHPLATRPVYMDDKARPHRSRAVTAYLQSEAMTSVPWPAMIPDFNPIEHIWDIYTGSGTSCAKHSSVGSSIASGMAAAITTRHPTSNWRDETQGWGRHPSTWVLHLVLNFEQYMSSSDSYVTYWKWNYNFIVLFELWRSILKMDMFYCKNWPCDIVIKYSLN